MNRRATRGGPAGRHPPPQIVPAPWEPTENFVPPKVFVMRDFNEHEGPSQAYVLEEGKDPIDLAHGRRHPNWGMIFFCLVYERVGPRAFRAQEEPQYVAVKRLNKRVVQASLMLGYQENPYLEVSRMREFGDDEHVLTCTEFLQDDEFLYIITPKAMGTTPTLKEAIWSGTDELIQPERVGQIFRKILKILKYLERNGICHRDLSPDNFLNLTDQNLVVFDLAMSVRIPVDGNGQPSLIRPRGRCGTLPYMAPEIWRMRDYDGVATDLYGASVILYSLLTNQYLYHRPYDEYFDFFVTCRYLSGDPLNPAVLDNVRRLTDQQQHGILNSLLERAEAHSNMSEAVIDLLDKLLVERPQDRYSLAQATNAAEQLGDNFRPVTDA